MCQWYYHCSLQSPRPPQPPPGRLCPPVTTLLRHWQRGQQQRQEGCARPSHVTVTSSCHSSLSRTSRLTDHQRRRCEVTWHKSPTTIIEHLAQPSNSKYHITWHITNLIIASLILTIAFTCFYYFLTLGIRNGLPYENHSRAEKAVTFRSNGLRLRLRIRHGYSHNFVTTTYRSQSDRKDFYVPSALTAAGIPFSGLSVRSHVVCLITVCGHDIFQITCGNFTKIYKLVAADDKDKLIKFWGQQVKDQGYIENKCHFPAAAYRSTSSLLGFRHMSCLQLF